jgi:hypothetical protein
MKKPGPQIDPRRERWVRELNLSYRQSKKITYLFLSQLDRCQSAEAQRILIRGVMAQSKDIHGRPVRTML